MLLIFFVSFSFCSTTFGFKDGGKILGVGGACDFFTICKTTFGLFRSFLGSTLGVCGPPESGVGVKGGFGLSGRLKSKFNLSGRLTGGLLGSVLFSLTFDEVSLCGAVKKHVSIRTQTKNSHLLKQ